MSSTSPTAGPASHSVPAPSADSPALKVSPTPTISTGPSPRGASPDVPEPVVLQPKQVQWNMVRVSIRSEAPHWTLRSCATTNVPATEYAEGAGPRTLDIPLVEKFDWALMDGPTERTFCAEAVSDDLAGHTSGTIRTTLDTNIRVYFRPMPYDTYCPSPHYGNPIRTGSWNRGRFMAMWGGERGAAGIPVEAQYQQPADSGTWKSVGQLTSDASGFIYIGYRHDRDTNVRVCRPGTGCSQLAGEEWIYYTRAVAYASSAPSVHHGYRFPLFVTVLPRYAGREVLGGLNWLQRQVLR
ncbi:MAG: hypothetical protein QG608_920 [Actinomycetota bacterium]|nr:hypothetical protein [Actinomycetota bacterium]